MVSILLITIILLQSFLKSEGNMLDYTESDWATTCKTGIRQTPINLNKNINYNTNQKYILLESANYTKLTNVPLTVRNSRTYAFDASGLGTLMVTKNGIKYKYNLADIHLHYKSEHRIEGQQYDFEVHLVHEKDADYMKYLTFPDPDAQNNLLVVGILFDSANNQPNPLIELMNIKTRSPATLDINQFYSTSEGFYHYLGSLTTPDCNESVNWIVLRTLRGVTTTQAQNVKDWVAGLYPNGNARSVKALGSREVYKVDDKSTTPISAGFFEFNKFLAVMVMMVLFN
jgi:carbonic anhydrase